MLPFVSSRFCMRNNPTVSGITDTFPFPSSVPAYLEDLSIVFFTSTIVIKLSNSTHPSFPERRAPGGGSASTCTPSPVSQLSTPAIYLMKISRKEYNNQQSGYRWIFFTHHILTVKYTNPNNHDQVSSHICR